MSALGLPPIDLAAAERIIDRAVAVYGADTQSRLVALVVHTWEVAEGQDDHWRMAAATAVLLSQARQLAATPAMALAVVRLAQLFADGFRTELAVAATVVPDSPDGL